MWGCGGFEVRGKEKEWLGPGGGSVERREMCRCCVNALLCGNDCVLVEWGRKMEGPGTRPDRTPVFLEDDGCINV